MGEGLNEGRLRGGIGCNNTSFPTQSSPMRALVGTAKSPARLRPPHPATPCLKRPGEHGGSGFWSARHRPVRGVPPWCSHTDRQTGRHRHRHRHRQTDTHTRARAHTRTHTHTQTSSMSTPALHRLRLFCGTTSSSARFRHRAMEGCSVGQLQLCIQKAPCQI